MATSSTATAAAEGFDDFSDVKLTELPETIQAVIRNRTNSAASQSCGRYLEEYNLCLAQQGRFLLFKMRNCNTHYEKMQHCCESFDRTPIENYYKREYLLGRLWSTQYDRNKDILAVTKGK